jgi:hypothetical protein
MRRHLTRLNASVNVGVSDTEAVLKNLEKQQYINRIMDRSIHGGESDSIWCLGARGKTELSIAAGIGLLDS